MICVTFANVEMDGFSLNFDSMQFIKNRINEEDQMAEFMVYDSWFFTGFAYVNKLTGKFVRWITGSIILIALNTLFIYIIFFDKWMTLKHTRTQFFPIHICYLKGK